MTGTAKATKPKRTAAKAGRAAANPEVEAFIDGLPDGRREAIRHLHESIAAAVPDLVPAMWANTIGYGRYQYRYANGREGEWFVVGLASNKSSISVHFCALTEDGAYLAEANRHRLGKASVGRSCARYKKAEDIDATVIADLAREAAAGVSMGTFAT